jgi:hypothetical protein
MKKDDRIVELTYFGKLVETENWNVFLRRQRRGKEFIQCGQWSRTVFPVLELVENTEALTILKRFAFK